MRLLIFLLSFGVLAGGGYYFWEHNPPFRHFVEEKIACQIFASPFRTLEIRYGAESLMQTHKAELLKNNSYTYLEPELQFHPYLMMEVKYANAAHLTQEGVLLFGLVDGEMVLEGSRWEKTHGFEDCLLANATSDDFKILRLITEEGGSVDREKLYQKGKVDAEVLDKWINHCRQKKLITLTGNTLRLHLEKPKLTFTPATILKEPLVTFPGKENLKIKGKYRASQLRNLAQAAFGTDFAIRREAEIYLPVYLIRVQNPDGSILTTEWNALTGIRNPR